MTASTAMPKTTTFKYVSGSTSIGTTSNSATPPPSTTTYSSSEYTERIERRHVNYNADRTTWMDATDSQPHEAFFYVELLCNIWFIVEFTTRFVVIACSTQSRILLCDANICDGSSICR